MRQNGYDPDWASVNVHEVPDIKVKPPGPKSRAIQQRSEKYMQGYSSQAQLFPVAFESGSGVILTDVDGNRYIDFSSGIYVTNWGHCHPKITEAVVEYTRKLQNCHDFNTEIKTRLAEALVKITPGDLNNVQLWCEGSKCVEAGLNVARAVTGKHEFISFYNDMHGKTLGAQSLTVMTKVERPPGRGVLPRPLRQLLPLLLQTGAPGLRPAMRGVSSRGDHRTGDQRGGGHRGRAHPGLGRQRHPARRLAPQDTPALR